MESNYINFKRSILGVKCSDGVIIAAEKLLTSKLLAKNTNPTILHTYLGKYNVILYLCHLIDTYM